MRNFLSDDRKIYKARRLQDIRQQIFEARLRNVTMVLLAFELMAYI